MVANRKLLKYWYMTILSVILIWLLPSEVEANKMKADTLFGEIITIDYTTSAPYGQPLHIWAAFEQGLRRYELDFSENGYLPGKAVPIAEIDTPDVINMYTRDTTVYVVCSTGIYWYEPYEDIYWDPHAVWNSMLETGIKDCAVDSLNRIWFITEDSVFCYTTTGTRVQYLQGELEQCQAIGVDVDNTIWISYRPTGKNYSQICSIHFGSEEILFYPFIKLDTSGVFSTSYLQYSLKGERICVINSDRNLVWYKKSTDTWEIDTFRIVPDSVTINELCIYWDYWHDRSNRIAAVATSNGIYWGHYYMSLKYHEIKDTNCISVIPAPMSDVTAFAASEGGVTFEVLNPCLSIAPHNKTTTQIQQPGLCNLQGKGILVNLLGRAVHTRALQKSTPLSAGIYFYCDPALRQTKRKFLHLR